MAKSPISHRQKYIKHAYLLADSFSNLFHHPLHWIVVSILVNPALFPLVLAFVSPIETPPLIPEGVDRVHSFSLPHSRTHIPTHMAGAARHYYETGTYLSAIPVCSRSFCSSGAVRRFSPRRTPAFALQGYGAACSATATV